MRILFAVAFCLSSVSLFGGTWYVDASRPDDTGDGLSPETAKKHIQSSVDLAEASSDDMLTVLVAPGTYESGEYVDSNGAKNRVVIKKAMTLKATGSRDDTFIVGALSASGAYGLGSDSVRCVCVDGQSDAGAVDGTVIQGFTFRDGSAGLSDSGTSGGGGAVCFNKDSGGSVYVKDCTASNCAAYYGGGFRGVVAIRSLVKKCHNNGVTGRGAALYKCKAYNCIFVENGPTSSYNEYILQGVGPYVNCTAVANNGSLLRTGANQLMYNSISILASRQEFDSSNCGGDHNLGGNLGKQTGSHVLTDTEARAVMAAPLTGDYRPLSTGLAIGYGATSYCSLDWIPSDDRNKDYFGNPRIVGNSVDAGAIQGGVTAAGGTLISLELVPTTGSSVYQRKWFANALTWPEQVRIVPPEGTFCVKVNGAYPRFNDSNGGFWQTIPPTGTTVTLSNVAATATLEVGADKPYATIQAAVDAAGAGAADYTIIKVSPGTYATGETELVVDERGMSNRVAIVDRNVFLVATGSAADTAIVGAIGSAASGLGGDAVRCVGVDAGTDRFVALRGFTLRDGATKETADSGRYADIAAGGFFTTANDLPDSRRRVQLLESTVTGCRGYMAGATCGGWLQNCTVTGNDSTRMTVRASLVSGSVLAENSVVFDQLIGDGSGVYFSTIIATRNGTRQAIASASSGIRGSIVMDGNLSKAVTAYENIFWNLTGSGGPSSGFVTVDPQLAGPADGFYAPCAGSPAFGGATASGITDLYIYGIGDYRLSPLNVTDDGKVTVGAIHAAYQPRTIHVATDGDDARDGLTRATAKQTLAGAARAATCQGDTIRVAAGTYESGTMTQTVAVVKASFSEVPSRAILKPGVALVSDEGAAVTKIRGVTSDQSTAPGPWIRGLVLGNGASVKGFTFENCGARATKNSWVPGNMLDDYLGGTLLSSTNVGDSVTIADCVFTGAMASFGGIGFGRATYRRCVFAGNTNRGSSDDGAGLVYCGTFENCLFTGNESRLIALGSYGDIRNCSFVSNIWSTSTSIFGYGEAGAQVCNTLVADVFRGASSLGSARNVFLPKVSGKAWNWTIVEGGETCITNVTLAANDPGLCDAGAWTNSAHTVDRGDNGLVGEETDLAGTPRVRNGTVDIGCYERDPRGDYSALLSSRGDVTVTAASSDVTAVAGGVRLSDGSTLAVDWADRGMGSEIPYRLNVDLAGAGTLTVRNGDQVVATLTTSGTHVLNLTGSSPIRLTFAFAGDEATATLSRFGRARGSTLIVR